MTDQSLIALAEKCGAFHVRTNGAYGNMQAGAVIFTAKEWEAFAAALTREQEAQPIGAHEAQPAAQAPS